MYISLIFYLFCNNLLFGYLNNLPFKIKIRYEIDRKLVILTLYNEHEIPQRIYYFHPIIRSPTVRTVTQVGPHYPYSSDLVSDAKSEGKWIMVGEIDWESSEWLGIRARWAIFLSYPQSFMVQIVTLYTWKYCPSGSLSLGDASWSIPVSLRLTSPNDIRTDRVPLSLASSRRDYSSYCRSLSLFLNQSRRL